MARDPEITVRVKGDASGAESALSKSQAAVVGFSAAAGTALANYADRAIRGAVRVGVAMVEQASLAQQSAGAVSAVFGQYADDVTAFAENAADAVGLSAAAYGQLAAVLGSQLAGAGVPLEQVADKTNDLIQLGADLAATYGGTVSEAVSAVSSLLRGERDPIERYAVSINQAAIDAYKAANGLDGLTGAAKAQADQQATLALLFEKTAAAQGMFASESDTLAGAQERLNAKWADAQAALGEALIPLMTIAAQVLGTFAEYAKENSDTVTALVVILGALAAAVWLVNIAMAANPIGLIIIAVGLLIAIIAVLITNWDTVVKKFEEGAQQIGDFFAGIVNWVVQLWQGMVSGLRGAWDGFIGWINGTIDAMIGWIQDAINWFGQLFGAANNANSAANSAAATGTAATAAAPASAFTLSALSVSAAPPPATSAAAANVAAATMRARLRGGDSGNTYIEVNGALDPNAVAKQVSGLLRGRNARVGLGAAAGVRA